MADLFAQDNPPVVCPAIEVQDDPGPQGLWGPGTGPPTLAVLGTATKDRSAPVWPGLAHLKIEQVIFGHYAGGEVACSRCPDGRRILFLAPAGNQGSAEFDCKDTMAPSDIAAAKALCTARLDLMVLGTASIFVAAKSRPNHLKKSNSRSLLVRR